MDLRSENKNQGRRQINSTTISEEYLRFDDEDPVLLPLDGINESPEVLVCGWTKNIVKGFPSLKKDLNVQTVSMKDRQKRNSWPKNFTFDLIDNVKSLKDFASQAQAHWLRFTHNPVCVIVLAKKNLQLMMKNGQLLIYGQIVVGDDSGFCDLLTVNNAIQTLYQQAEVGDRVLINDGQFKKKQPTPFNSCFDESLHLDLELKATHYQCRRVFRLVDVSQPKFPAIILAGKQLRLPSTVPGLEDVLDLSTPCSEFFDIIGVVSYVGRVERNWMSQWVTQKENEQNLVYQTYFAHRWLELVDATVANPLPITLYLNQNNWDLQARLIPGSVIIITNVSKPTSSYSGYPKLQSSVFTQIYINGDIGNYMERMPGVASGSTMELFGSGRMKEILGRQDICWSAGGMYSQPFAPDSETEFYKTFIENPDKSGTKGILRAPRIPFSRREAQRIHFKGRILKFRILTVEQTGLMWCSNKFSGDVLNYTKFAPIFPFVPQLNWYAFTKEFPKLDFSNLPATVIIGKRTGLNEFVSESYKKYCGPLLMPPTECALLKDLPIIDGPPYYWVMIVDDEKRHLYHCIWKPSKHLNVDQMTLKLEQSKDKPVIGILDFFCMNDKAKDLLKYEIHLQDFTTILGPRNPAVERSPGFKRVENELADIHGEPMEI